MSAEPPATRFAAGRDSTANNSGAEGAPGAVGAVGAVGNPSTVDAGALLLRLVDQHTAALSLQMEALRIQRTLVEHVLGTTVAAGRPLVPPPPPPRGDDGAEPIQAVRSRPVASSIVSAPPAPDDAEVPPPDHAPAGEDVDYAALDMDVRRTAPLGAGEEGPRPASDVRAGLRVIKGGADGAGAGKARSGVEATTETIRIGVTPDTPELARLKRLRAAAAHGIPNPVLGFGPHQGKHLHELAQADPEYLTGLMTSARTPELRLAARKLVEYLGLNRRPLPLQQRGRRPVRRRFT